MTKFIVFMPDNVEIESNQYCYGDIEFYNDTVVFYVVEKSKEPIAKLNYIGVVSKNQCMQDSGNNFVNIIFDCGKYEILAINIDNEYVAVDVLEKTLLVLYNRNAFVSCEHSRETNDNNTNYCQILENKLRKYYKHKTEKSASLKWLNYLVTVLHCFSIGLNRLSPLLKYSSIGVHIKITFDRFHWAVKDIYESKKLSIKVGNFIASVIIDVVLGFMCLSAVTNLISMEEFPGMFLWTAETVVLTLRELLKWLLGSPAGFKLNMAFNNILGQFYLFHTEIWWLFIAALAPCLEVTFRTFILLGRFGVTLQAAILSDLLGLVSFHTYCIYAYAARLYNIQLSGLISLWRLFLGRKMNPIREKVDSCQYSNDQLFVGTLLFTVALFLFPTTLIYYIVFTSMRLLIVGFGGILVRLRRYIYSAPIYSTFLWFLRSSKIKNEVRMEPDYNLSSPGVTVVRLKRVPSAITTTVKDFIPDCAVYQSEDMSSFGAILGKVINGELLYPV